MATPTLHQLKEAETALSKNESVTLASVPDGFDALVLADLARAVARAGKGGAVSLVMVARDGRRQAELEAGLSFAAPDIEVLSFPNWDCQPYDRASPNAGLAGPPRRRADRWPCPRHSASQEHSPTERS